MRSLALSLVLLFAASGVAVAAPKATPPPATPAPESPRATPRALMFAQPVVFAFGISPDQGLNARISVALAQRLGRSTGKAPFKRAFVVPEGTWTIADFAAQCAADPIHTIGAIILLPPSAGSEDVNYLLLTRTTESIKFNAMIAQCSYVVGIDPVSIAWVSDTASGEFGHSAVQFLPLAALTSVYLALAPSRTYTTTQTVAYPVPNPLPAGGARTTVQTQNSSQLNPTGTGTLQSNVVGAAASDQLALGRKGASEYLVMGAADDAAGKLIAQKAGYCATLAANPVAVTPPPAMMPVPQPTPVPTQYDAWRNDFCQW